jgi:hypothetical protein
MRRRRTEYVRTKLRCSYERTDKKRGEFFHCNWTGRGGTTASTTYNA